MIIRIIVPLLYIILVGGAFGMICGGWKIELALAPALFMQVLIMLFTGIIFGSLRLGAMIGAVLATSAIIYACIKEISESAMKDNLC